MLKTNAFGLLTVFVRGAAVWIAAHVVILGVQAGMTLQRVDLGTLWMVGGGGVLLAAVLWLFADVLVRATLAAPRSAPFESDLTLADWQVLVFSAIGLAMLVFALIDIAAMGVYWFAGREEFAYVGADEYKRIMLPRLGSALIQGGIGIGLMFGARGLAGLLRRYREIGMPAVTPEPPEAVGSDADSGQHRH